MLYESSIAAKPLLPTDHWPLTTFQDGQQTASRPALCKKVSKSTYQELKFQSHTKNWQLQASVFSQGRRAGEQLRSRVEGRSDGGVLGASSAGGVVGAGGGPGRVLGRRSQA